MLQYNSFKMHYKWHVLCGLHRLKRPPKVPPSLRPNIILLNQPLYSCSFLAMRYVEIETMSPQNGDVIAIDKFTSKVSQFDPKSLPLFALVDMGR